MVQGSLGHATEPPRPAQGLGSEATWSAIFSSLARLEAGLHNVDGDLGRIRTDLEALSASLDVPDRAARGSDGPAAAMPAPESDPCGEGLLDALAAGENGLPAPGDGGGVT